MTTSIRTLLSVALFSASTLAGFGARRATRAVEPTLPFYRDSSLTPEFTTDTATMHRISPFALVDQSGAPVTERQLDGHITVVSFFYSTCENLCPRLRSRLAAVRDAVARDPRVQIVSVTIAPEHDSAAVLDAYARVNGIERGRWRLLTGTRPEIERLARSSFFAEAPMLRGTAARHGETIWLVDGERRLRGLYNGTQPIDAARLVEDIATLAALRRGD
jgi:protein SCO1/2